MKHLGLVYVLLLLGIGLFMGQAMAQLTASQNVPPSLNIGENAMVTVTLTYYGGDATEAIITPGLPPGIETSNPADQTAHLSPGITAPISYPIRAVQSGTYLVTSLVEYSEEGTWRNLRLESPLAVTGQPMQQHPSQAVSTGIGMPTGENLQNQSSINQSNPYGVGVTPISANQSDCMPNSPAFDSPYDPYGVIDSYPGDATAPAIHPDRPMDRPVEPDMDIKQGR